MKQVQDVPPPSSPHPHLVRRLVALPSLAVRPPQLRALAHGGQRCDVAAAVGGGEVGGVQGVHLWRGSNPAPAFRTSSVCAAGHRNRATARARSRRGAEVAACGRDNSSPSAVQPAGAAHPALVGLDQPVPAAGVRLGSLGGHCRQHRLFQHLRRRDAVERELCKMTVGKCL
jgi:hypothetical protein